MSTAMRMNTRLIHSPCGRGQQKVVYLTPTLGAERLPRRRAKHHRRGSEGERKNEPTHCALPLLAVWKSHASHLPRKDFCGLLALFRRKVIFSPRPHHGEKNGSGPRQQRKRAECDSSECWEQETTEEQSHDLPATQKVLNVRDHAYSFRA
jgi:hypothetical protein